MKQQIVTLREEIARMVELLNAGELDTKRLDWLIKNTAWLMYDDDKGWFVAYYDREPQQSYSPAAREALDAGSKEQG